MKPCPFPSRENNTSSFFGIYFGIWVFENFVFLFFDIFLSIYITSYQFVYPILNWFVYPTLNYICLLIIYIFYFFGLECHYLSAVPFSPNYLPGLWVVWFSFCSHLTVILIFLIFKS